MCHLKRSPLCREPENEFISGCSLGVAGATGLSPTENTGNARREQSYRNVPSNRRRPLRGQGQRSRLGARSQVEWGLTLRRLCLPGEADHGGGRHTQVCPRRQQPHHLLLR